MSNPADLIPSPPTSAVRNTVGKGNEKTLENPNGSASDAALREYYDKHYHQLLPIIAEKVHQERAQHDKLKAVKACLNFNGWEVKKKVCSHIQKAVTRVPAREKWNPFPENEIMKKHLQEERERSRKVKIAREDIGSQDQKYKNQALKKMTCNVKTYDGSEDLKDLLKIFQAAAKVERWAMPTWCHMFNSKLTRSARVWFDDLPSESVDSYDDLKKAFLVNFLQQKKCIKDPVKIHHIKQREGESTKDFVQCFKAESRHVKGAPECNHNIPQGRSGGFQPGAEKGNTGMEATRSREKTKFRQKMRLQKSVEVRAET
ncbi:reverse transcriptase domain-containing protein [Tanacetum coccineum]